MEKFTQNLHKNDQGVTLVEYGLAAALVAVAAVTMLQNVGNGVNRAFTNVNSKLPAAAAAPRPAPAPAA